MRRALALAITVLFIHQAQAGDKKTVVTPERVGQLLTILRSDLNEENRAHAAEELGRVDGSRYPEIIPLLIETLRSDPKPAVRAEVVDSLAKIRPITKEAGKALDAAKEDGSFKVRWHARTAVRTYHSAGYQEQEKKVAGTPSKAQAQPVVVYGPDGMPVQQSVTPVQQSGGWLANLKSKQIVSPDPVVSKPQPQPATDNQSGGWLYHMLAKPASPKNQVMPTEPPLAGSTEIVIPRSSPTPVIQSTGGNPFADIPSAPATQPAKPKTSPYMPQTPVVPVLPSKPNDGGQ